MINLGEMPARALALKANNIDAAMLSVHTTYLWRKMVFVRSLT
jgi:hypothetical protein